MFIIRNYRNRVFELVMESWEPRIGAGAASTLAESIFFGRLAIGLMMTGMIGAIFLEAVKQTGFPIFLDCLFFLIPGVYCLYKRVQLGTDASYEAKEALGTLRPPVGNLATFDSWLKNQKK